MVQPRSTAPSVSGQPARGSDANGWFNHPITVNFVGSDGASGVASCTSAVYSGPDTGGTTLNGSCTDVAGNTGSGSYSLKYDSTPPTATSASLSRGPDANGWYNHPVDVTFGGSDGLSGINACTSVTYGGPESGSATVSGTCTDKAGNTSAPLTTRFAYDGTPPSVSAQPSRAPDSNGWYNHPLSISFAGSDGGSGVASCTSASYGGPDGGANISGSCADNAGNVGSATFGLNYDSTPPTGMVGALARPPDHNGWYNHPVQVHYSATDATSGNVSCSDPTYKGPDSATAQVTGSCSDAAGNTATGAPVSFEYKATPPSISNLTVGVNDQFVSLKWALSPDATALQVTRSPGVDGASASTLLSNVATTLSDHDVQNGQTYIYTLTATDDAGNSATEDVSVIPAAALFSPAKGVVVTSPPYFAWQKSSGATYWNFQLYYDGPRSLAAAGAQSGALTPFSGVIKGHKVLSAWPTKPAYRLKTAWAYNGKQRKLVPGHYRWFVWPGYGKRKAHKYGPLLGQSDFTVRHR